MSEDKPGIVGAVAGVAGRVVEALPPAFLGLCLVNTIFVLGLLWFLHGQIEMREKAFETVMRVCSESMVGR
jgi:hypothetical protein